MERAYKYQLSSTNDNDDDRDSNDEISDNETTAMMSTEDNNGVNDLGYEDDEGHQDVTLDPGENPTTPPPDENQDEDDLEESPPVTPSPEENQDVHDLEDCPITPPINENQDVSDVEDNQTVTPPQDKNQDEELVTQENPSTPPPNENESVTLESEADPQTPTPDEHHDDLEVSHESGANAEDEAVDIEDEAPGIRVEVDEPSGDDQDGAVVEIGNGATSTSQPDLAIEISVAVGAADGDDKDLPPYGDPPTYEEAVSGATASPRVQQTKSYIEAVKDDDLEWDRDEPVEPIGSIELQEVVLDSGRESRRSIPSRTEEDTSFSTPGTVPSNAPLPRYTGDTQSSRNLPAFKFGDNSKRTLGIYAVSILAAVIALLLVILMPLTFSYVEYYQFGMQKGRISGVVQFAKDIYDYGRYAIGPANTFKRYPAWAHLVHFEGIDFYSSDGIILQAEMSFQYFIKQDELGLIEQKYDKSYKDIIKSVAGATIKNEAAKYSTKEYLSERAKVERRLHDAIRLKLGGNCCASRDECIRLAKCHLCSDDQDKCNRGHHVDVRFFQMKELSIPDEVAQRFITIQIILERNEEAIYRQDYELIIKDTELLTENILNEAAEIASNGTITARLIRKQGNTTSNAMRESAHSRGLTLLYDAVNVGNDQHKSSIHWLRTLERHQGLVMGSSYDAYVSLIQGLGDDD